MMIIIIINTLLLLLLLLLLVVVLVLVIYSLLYIHRASNNTEHYEIYDSNNLDVTASLSKWSPCLKISIMLI